MPAPEPRTLLVASTGGHLDELVRLSRRFRPAPGAVEWVTHDGPQVTRLLAGERVHLVPYVASRGYRSAASNLAPAARILRSGRWDRVVTTGAGIALPFVTVARMLSIPCLYVESAARSSGPSLTGSLLARLPGMGLATQHRSWTDPRWEYRGSVFDGFASEPRGPQRPARRVVVTLGTSSFEFARAVRSVSRLLPDVAAPDADVVWQVGHTRVEGLGLPPGARVAASVPDLDRVVAEADLVVAHAGVGSALTALAAGHRPVLLPRRAAHGEHVDDHQEQIALDLARRGLAVAVSPDDLQVSHLWAALGSRVVAEPGRPFPLAGCARDGGRR